MRKFYVVLAVLVAGFSLAAVLMLGGCSTSPVKGKGSLTVSLVEPMKTKMLLPAGDIDLEHCIVTVTHQESTTVISVEVSGSTGATFTAIEVGPYDVLVTGFNVWDELLMHGTGIATVIVDDSVSVPIQLEYESEDGSIAVDYTLTPADLIYNPSIKGQLWDKVSWTDVTITAHGPGAWSYDSVLAPGFYAHSFQLISNDLINVSGGLESVFIMSGRETAHLYEFSSLNIVPPITGDMVVIISEPIDQPFNSYFTDGLSRAYVEEDFTLTAEADITVDSWYWFKDGFEIPGEITSSLALTAPDVEGVNNFSVLCQAGGALSSASKLIQYTNRPDGLFTALWLEPAGPVNVPDTTEDYALSVDISDGIEILPDGFTIYWRLDPTSDAEALTTCSVVASSNISSGVVTNSITNTGSLAPGDHPVRIQISDTSDFSSLIFTSPTITYVTPPPVPDTLVTALWLEPAADVDVEKYDTPDFALSVDISDGIEILPDGFTIYWRIDPACVESAHNSLSVLPSSDVVSGIVYNNIHNIMGPGTFPAIVQISDTADFSSLIFSSPTIHY